MAVGELDESTFVANMQKLLGRKPRLAAQMIDTLKEAYGEDLIDAQTYASLKKRVEEASGVSQAAAEGTAEATQYAGGGDATVMLSDDERQAIAEEARAAATIDITTGQTTGAVDFDLSEPGSTTADSWSSTGTGATGTEYAEPGAEPAEALKIGPGTVLKERFKLLEVLGVGGMGTVYKAIDLLKEEARDRNPYVALKVLNEDFKQHPDAFIALQREASRQQKLAHPNIATVYDFDRTGSTVYITMELMEGTPLNTLIKKKAKAQGGMPFEEAWPIIEGLGKGLMYAHERSMVHSDFKPGNCFLLNDGTVKILDFGIARAVKNPQQGDAEKTLFDPGKLGALTPAYASAEMLEGEEPDPRDDIYALACVAYELLAGKHPFNKLPANTARDNNLLPAPVKTLKRKQMKGLMRGLAFSRENRSKDVAEFLEAVEGASNWYKNPLVIGAAVVLVAVLAGTPQLLGYLHEQRIETIVSEIRQDPAVFETYRQQLPALSTSDSPALTEADQKTILDEARDAIQQGYYGRLIESLVAANDFPRAERHLAELTTLYPDSSFVGSLQAEVEDKRNIRMAALNDEFVMRIEQGRLLGEGEGEGIAETLAQIQQISPNDPLLRDARLPAAFSRSAEAALADGELARAQTLVERGIAVTNRFAGDARKDANLVNLGDKIRNAMDQQALQAQIAELEGRIEEAMPTLKALPDYAGVSDAIARLAEIDPGNQVLADLRGELQPVVESEFARIREQRDWSSVEQVREEYRPMLAALDLDEGLLELSADRSAFNRRLDGLRTALAAAIEQGRLRGENGARSVLADIEAAAGGTVWAEQARNELARAHLLEARQARADGDFSTAREQVAAAGELQPGAAVEQAVEAELARIEAGRAAPQGAELERVAELESRIESELAGFDGTPAAARALAADLDELAALAPASPVLETARQRMAEQIAAAAADKGEAGDYTQAVNAVRAAMAVLPGSAVLNDTLSDLRAGAEAALAAEQQQAIASSKERIAALLADPQFDRAWQQAIQSELNQTSALLPAGDSWAEETRRKLTELYLERARQMRSEQRFAEANTMLDRALAHAPDAPAIAAEREALAQAEAEFNAARELELRQAEIDGLKQSLVTQAKAREVEAAAQTLAKLREIMPAGDPFLSEEAPRLLAQAYLARAEAEGAKDNYVAALRYAEQGLELAPDNAKLAQAKRSFTVKGNVSLLEQVFAEPTDLDVEQIDKRLSEIQVLDSGAHRALVTRLDERLAARISNLREREPEVARRLQEQGIEIFGEESATAGVDLEVSEGPPEVVSRLESALGQRRLGAAATLLEQARSEPAAAASERLAGLARELAAAREAAEEKLAEFESQAEALAGQLEAESGSVALATWERYERAASRAQTALSGARNAWRDRDYGEQEQRLAAIEENLERIEPSARQADRQAPPIAEQPVNPFIEPSPRSCSVALASHGDRLRGVCADLWARSGDKNYLGLQMVVVPAGEGMESFAIGKYEFAYRDLWKFCGISGWCSDEFRASIRDQAKNNADLPVTNLGINSAELIAQWMTQRTGQTYRLPTGAEWEWAANAGGEQPAKKDYNCRLVLDGELIRGHGLMSVQTGTQNGWGLYSYLGNAQEWVVSGGEIEVRGGSYQTSFSKCSTDLAEPHSGKQDGATGFRFVREMN